MYSRESGAPNARSCRPAIFVRAQMLGSAACRQARLVAVDLEREFDRPLPGAAAQPDGRPAWPLKRPQSTTGRPTKRSGSG
jgi:hypothetical protein